MDEQDVNAKVYHALEIRDLSIIANIKAANPGFSTRTDPLPYMTNPSGWKAVRLIRENWQRKRAKP